MHDDSSKEMEGECSLLRVDILPGRDTCLVGECLLEPECFIMGECSGENEFSDKEDRSKDCYKVEEGKKEDEEDHEDYYSGAAGCFECRESFEFYNSLNMWSLQAGVPKVGHYLEKPWAYHGEWSAFRGPKALHSP